MLLRLYAHAFLPGAEKKRGLSLVAGGGGLQGCFVTLVVFSVSCIQIFVHALFSMFGESRRSREPRASGTVTSRHCMRGSVGCYSTVEVYRPFGGGGCAAGGRMVFVSF